MYIYFDIYKYPKVSIKNKTAEPSTAAPIDICRLKPMSYCSINSETRVPTAERATGASRLVVDSMSESIVTPF